jgi:hypothetical protein
MPITQSRMLDLLIEHERVLSLYHDLTARLRHLAQADGITTLADFRDLLIAEIEATAHVPNTYAVVERRHFNAQGKRNNYMRLKAERKRRAQGIAPRNSDPTNSDNTSFIISEASKMLRTDIIEE